ncbi:ABC transporter permease [Bacillus sp. SD088]|uniref:ABC transporter permease n=1 Tax=Bacillus sp. SD088 TaxID=2782012 RepID=UPI001A95C891|nr:ABC transporter permease [Bacillus sp. SD088]MBO0992645.1 ABC transporter permease [Bacillus sp. SD088]
MTIFLFTIKRCFRNKMNIILLCVLPVIVILMPDEEWTLLPLGFQLYGVVLFFAAARLVSIIMDDRTKGVLMRIGVAPVTHLQYLWQNLLAYSLILIVQIILVIVGGLLYGHDLVHPLLLFVVYALFAMTAIGFSLAWFSLFRHKETAFVILMSFIMLMSMGGGMLWSLEMMPELMQRLAMLLPTYWLVESMTIVASQANKTELLVPLIILLLFTVTFLVIGSKRRLS